MTTITPEKLIISITDNSPQERRIWIIKALSAALRWNAYAGQNKKKADTENVVVLTELLDELVETN